MLLSLQFKGLCHLHSGDVYRYARHLLGCEADAEDVAQEVLLKLWKHMDNIDLLKARSWLMRTTRNQCLDHMRRSRARPAVQLDPDMPEPADPRAADPAESAHRAVQRDRLAAALQELPEGQRSVFILREINGLRYREIARTLDLPVNTVKVYLSRARTTLLHLVNDSEPTHEDESRTTGTEEAHA